MDSSKIYPRTGDKQTVYLKSAITRPTIEVGDFTIYNDFVNDPRDFEKNNVLYHYPINHDRLIIGKFCSIACGAKFIYEAENRNDGVWIVFSLDNCIFAIRMYGKYGFETIAERDHDYLMIKYCDNEKYTGNNISGAIQELAVSTPFV